jgi:hypothetical protein
MRGRSGSAAASWSGARVPAELSRPAFYALAAGGWRDYVTLLHLPYTAWHLSYVAIGVALGDEFSLTRLLAALAAFFLGLGIAAHALDELNGRPLETRIRRGVLVTLAVAGLAGAAVIGIAGAALVETAVAWLIAPGVFIAVAYNLELFGGRFHGDFWFALAWGAFPVLAGSVAAGGVTVATALAAVFAFALSHAQRQLSTRVRKVRRTVASVGGTLMRRDGATEPLAAADLVRAEEAALRALTAATIALAAALVALRVA